MAVAGNGGNALPARMDQNTPREEMQTKPRKPARVALNVLALCFALSVIGRGLGESFTVFLKPISESFGWDRAQVVSVYSLAALAGGLASPVIGRLFDRSGPRAVYSLGLMLLGGAFLIAAHAQKLWQLQLSVGLCVGTGMAFIGNVPNSILLGRWFGPRLPTAMSIVYSATGAGVLALFVKAGLVASNGEARRQIKGGGLRVNDAAITDEKLMLKLADLTPEGVVKLSLGKKRHVLLKPA